MGFRRPMRITMARWRCPGPNLHHDLIGLARIFWVPARAPCHASAAKDRRNQKLASRARRMPNPPPRFDDGACLLLLIAGPFDPANPFDLPFVQGNLLGGGGGGGGGGWGGGWGGGGGGGGEEGLKCAVSSPRP